MRNPMSLCRALAVTTLAVLACATAPAAPASAAGTHQATARAAGVFTLCSQGGYDSYASFPERGSWAVIRVGNGTCGTYILSGQGNERVDVYVAGGRYIGTTVYNGSVGETIVTIQGPSFYAYVS